MPITLLSPSGRVVVGYDLRVEVRKRERKGRMERRQSREGWGDKKESEDVYRPLPLLITVSLYDHRKATRVRYDEGDYCSFTRVRNKDIVASAEYNVL